MQVKTIRMLLMFFKRGSPRPAAFPPAVFFSMTTCKDLCEPKLEGPNVMYPVPRDIRTPDEYFSLHVTTVEDHCQSCCQASIQARR